MLLFVQLQQNAAWTVQCDENSPVSVAEVGKEMGREIYLMHMASTPGDLLVSFGGGSGLSAASSCPIPVGQMIGPIKLAPGAHIKAMSTQGTRYLGVIMSPTRGGE